MTTNSVHHAALNTVSLSTPKNSLKHKQARRPFTLRVFTGSLERAGRQASKRFRKESFLQIHKLSGLSWRRESQALGIPQSLLQHPNTPAFALAVRTTEECIKKQRQGIKFTFAHLKLPLGYFPGEWPTNYIDFHWENVPGFQPVKSAIHIKLKQKQQCE